MMEYGLAGSKDTNNVATKLESHREIWEIYAQDFTSGLQAREKQFFKIVS